MPLVNNLAGIRQDAIFIRVNGDTNREYSRYFNLRRYPSIIGFYANSNGRRHELMSSYFSFDNLNSFVDKLIRR